MTTRYFALQPATMPAPTGLLRLTLGDAALVLEHYDPAQAGWVDDPKAIDFLNGDDADATEVDEVAAMKLMGQLKPA